METTTPQSSQQDIEQIVKSVCEFWMVRYLNLDEYHNKRYDEAVWRYRLVPQKSEGDVKEWTAVWQLPNRARPISNAVVNVFWKHDPVENCLQFRYESQQLTNKLDLSKDIVSQVTSICDKSLFHPAVQLEQVRQGKERVCQLVRTSEWLKQANVYGQFQRNVAEIEKQVMNAPAVNEKKELEATIDQIYKKIPSKLLTLCGEPSSKDQEFQNRLDKLYLS